MSKVMDEWDEERKRAEADPPCPFVAPPTEWWIRATTRTQCFACGAPRRDHEEAPRAR